MKVFIMYACPDSITNFNYLEELRIIRTISVRVPNWIYQEDEICMVNAKSHCYTRSILVCLYANTITLKSACCDGH